MGIYGVLLITAGVSALAVLVLWLENPRTQQKSKKKKKKGKFNKPSSKEN